MLCHVLTDVLAPPIHHVGVTSTERWYNCLLDPVYMIQPVVQPVWQPAVSCKQTSNRLSNRLSNPFDNRFDNHVERTATVRSTSLTTVLNDTNSGCSFNHVERTATVRSTGCPTGLYNRFDNRLYTRYSRLSSWLSNGFYNRLNVCIHDTTSC